MSGAWRGSVNESAKDVATGAAAAAVGVAAASAFASRDGESEQERPVEMDLETAPTTVAPRLIITESSGAGPAVPASGTTGATDTDAATGDVVDITGEGTSSDRLADGAPRGGGRSLVSPSTAQGSLVAAEASRTRVRCAPSSHLPAGVLAGQQNVGRRAQGMAYGHRPVGPHRARHSVQQDRLVVAVPVGFDLEGAVLDVEVLAEAAQQFVENVGLAAVRGVVVDHDVRGEHG